MVPPKCFSFMLRPQRSNFVASLLKDRLRSNILNAMAAQQPPAAGSRYRKNVSLQVQGFARYLKPISYVSRRDD